MCYHVKFGSSASKGVCINRRETNNWGALWNRPLAVAAWLTHRNTPLPTRIVLPNLVVLGQTIRVLLRRSAWNIWPLASRLSRSLKVIGTDTDRCPSRTVSEINGDFSRKPQILPTPVYLTPPMNGFTLELGTGAWCQKTRMMELPGRKRSLTISSATWIQYTNGTDGHRATAKTAFTHSVAREKRMKDILNTNLASTVFRLQNTAIWFNE